jgi:hypothetical protein
MRAFYFYKEQEKRKPVFGLRFFQERFIGLAYAL